jgi:ricin-type beta-trefoil lectin protein
MKRRIPHVTFLLAIAMLAIGNRENSAATQGVFDAKSYYRLTTKWQGDGKSLDVVNDGKNNNQLILAKTGKFSGQLWKITSLGAGYYRLTTQWQGEGKSLDIVNDRKNNNQPILADTGNYFGQFWKISKVK